ncbi:MAG: hypothetical protein RLZZ171_1908, partial [Cyanobacteriota bacterium]
MKIGTQLTAGAFGIGTIVLLNLGVIFLSSSENNAKEINLSGVVRGGTQRSIKLELFNSADDKLITRIDKIIEGLLKGSEELNLSPATDPNYIAKMKATQ